MTTERWVCKRCFTSVDGSVATCPTCGLIRGSEVPAGGTWTPTTGAEAQVPAAGAEGQPPAQAPTAAPVPAWQRLLRFWWVPVAVIVVGTGWFLSARRDDSGAITDAGSLTAADLRVGDCFDLQDDSQDTVENVDAKPCSEPHVYQMFFVGDLPSGDYPSQDIMDTYAYDNCLPAFASHVGVSYEESILDIFYLTPTQDSWDSGDHSVQCAAHRIDMEPVKVTFQNYRQ
ncbi:MAG: septum formation family protein [Candidatus Limnocylindria bacterium]